MSKLFEGHPDATCLIYREGELIFTSEYKGVRPLMEYMKAYGPSDVPLTVIDRIMGRGAVLLAKLIGATQIKTPIMSETAVELAEEYGLNYEVDKVVPYIINRAGNGRCPIETAVLDISDVDEGYGAIKAAIAILMQANK